MINLEGITSLGDDFNEYVVKSGITYEGLEEFLNGEVAFSYNGIIDSMGVNQKDSCLGFELNTEYYNSVRERICGGGIVVVDTEMGQIQDYKPDMFLKVDNSGSSWGYAVSGCDSSVTSDAVTISYVNTGSKFTEVSDLQAQLSKYQELGTVEEITEAIDEAIAILEQYQKLGILDGVIEKGVSHTTKKTYTLQPHQVQGSQCKKCYGIVGMNSGMDACYCG